MDSYIWVRQGCLTSKNLHQLCVDTGCSLEDLPGFYAGKIFFFCKSSVHKFKGTIRALTVGLIVGLGSSYYPNREELQPRAMVVMLQGCARRPSLPTRADYKNINSRVKSWVLDRMGEEIYQVFFCYVYHNSEKSLLKSILQSVTNISQQRINLKKNYHQ